MSTEAFITSRETGISVPESHLNILPPPQTCLFLIEGKLPCNIALASAVHQRESAIRIHVPPPLKPPSLWAVTEPWVLRPLSHTVSPHWLAVLHMAVYMLPCSSLYLSHPRLPSPASLLCLHLLCCSVNRFISTIFLDSIYMH